MARLFEEHRIRHTQSLNGAWRFSVDPEDQGKQSGWQKSIPSSCTVAVPSVWNTQQGLLSYEGVAWYEKDFHTWGGCLRFCFGAVMTEAQVFLDGKLLGSHYGGFSQFDFIVPDVEEGRHRLSVRIDNRFDAHSIPQKEVDWFHYGGITRGVTVETLYGICILNCRLEYTLSDDLTRASCTPVAELYNTKKRKAEDTLGVSLNGTPVCSLTVQVRGQKRESVKLPSFTVDRIKLWDVGCPNLYTLCIASETDDLYDRVGFRLIKAENGGITLNHRPLEFRGVNRHEEHPDWGFAFPLALMKKDIDLVTELGCNAIRGSHYPNSREFTDLLDETGILFWSEIPMWGNAFSAQTLCDPLVVERGLNMHREMVKYYYNHPCIVMWGIHSNIDTASREAYDVTKRYYTFLKERGGNRLAVYSTHDPLTDLCLEFSDVICVNRSFAWQDSKEPMDSETFLKRLVEYKASLRMDKKPMIMSKFGRSAIAGYHDDSSIRWTEENQAQLLTHCLQLFHGYPGVAGGFIGQLFDTRTSSEITINRARGYNNKGLLSEYRKPKLSYHAVQQHFSAWATEKKEKTDKEDPQ